MTKVSEVCTVIRLVADKRSKRKGSLTAIHFLDHMKQVWGNNHRIVEYIESLIKQYKTEDHDCKSSPDSSCPACEALLKASVTQDLPRRREIISQGDYPPGMNFI